MGFPVRGRFDPRARLGYPMVILEKLSGATGSCNRTCIIAGQRWRALTSAESVKTPCFQRSPAPTSGSLISDKREVGSSSSVGGENLSLVPQLGPQTPRTWSNLNDTRTNNRPSNTLTRSNLGYLRSSLRIYRYRTLNQ